MEAVMPKQTQSSMHAYLNWAKERIDEMDAALASLESRAIQAQAESKTKAKQLIADLKKRRDEFEATARKQAEAGEAAWQRTKAELESQWHRFESQLQTYFETVGKEVEQQQDAFRSVAAVQAKAWRKAADEFHTEAARLAAAKRADVDAAVKQMQVHAADAEARIQRLKQAGSESWTALSAALAESRNAFDAANQHVLDALKRAGAPHA
jgi:leucyl aminopeptidase (aminopeptidase T)